MKTPSLMQSSTVMAAGTATSRVLGFVRVIVLNLAIGATAGVANAFDIANKIPNVLYLLVAGGVLNAILVPQIVRASKHDDGGHEYLDRLITMTMAAIGVLTVAVTVSAPILVRVYGSSLDDEATITLMIAFAYFALPQVFFYGLYTVLGQILNAKNSFGPFMWAPVIGNVVGIGALIIWVMVYGRGDLDPAAHPADSWSFLKVAGLAGGSSLSIVAQALFLYPFLRNLGYRYRPRWGFRGVGLGSASHVAGWTFATIIMGQLVFIVTTQVGAAASGRAAATGSDAIIISTAGNAAYTQAFVLFMLPHSIIAVSLVTALFTRLSNAAIETDRAAVRADLSLGLRILGVVSAVSMAGLIAMYNEIGIAMTGVAGSGFAIGIVTAAMAVGLLPFSANYLLQRVFYAYEDARTPFLAQIPTQMFILIGNAIAYFYADPRYMVAIVGLGMAVGNWAGAATAWWALQRKLGDLEIAHVVWANLKMLTAGVIAGGVGYLVLHTIAPAIYGAANPVDATASGVRMNAVVIIAIVSPIILGIYAVALRLLRVEEALDVIAMARRRLGRASASQ